MKSNVLIEHCECAFNIDIDKQTKTTRSSKSANLTYVPQASRGPDISDTTNSSLLQQYNGIIKVINMF